MPVTTRPDPDTTVHPVDEILPTPRLFALGLQHVLVMYAGAVAVPLILGAALKLPKDQIALLINADLLVLRHRHPDPGAWARPGVGIRLPVMMGVTFASVSPMLAMAANPVWGSRRSSGR
jgi:xanthine/uracil permease